jgi:translation initiation factor 2 subunit 2
MPDSTDISDYKSLVARAKSKIPDKKATHERLQIPPPEVLIEGKTTVFRNFGDIADVIRREADHVLAYILTELGTAGRLDGKRVIFKGKVGAKQVEDKIQDYINTYVNCTECKRPDTRLVKEDRIMMLVCESCAAKRPVMARKAAKTQEKAEKVEEGKIYDVYIEDVGKKGDGVARRENYIIYIPGAMKGQSVKVRVEKVVGTVCFGKLVAS